MGICRQPLPSIPTFCEEVVARFRKQVRIVYTTFRDCGTRRSADVVRITCDRDGRAPELRKVI
jgi:hypothetical protein